MQILYKRMDYAKNTEGLASRSHTFSREEKAWYNAIHRVVPVKCLFVGEGGETGESGETAGRMLWDSGALAFIRLGPALLAPAESTQGNIFFKAVEEKSSRLCVSLSSI